MTGDILSISLDEPSILEYARFHGLTIPYASGYTNQHVVLRDTAGDYALWSDDRPVSPPAATDTDGHLHERLTVSSQAILLLADAQQLAENLEYEIDDSPLTRLASLKQELPLLQSDNELQLRHFGKRAEPDTRNVSLRAAAVDDERDEGIHWPTSMLSLPSRITADISAGKLRAGSETVLFLHETLHMLAKEPKRSDKAFELSYARTCRTRQLTPPLLPLSPPQSPLQSYILEEDLKCFSDPSDILTAESNAIEHRLMAEDALISKREPFGPPVTAADTSVGESSSPLRFVPETPLHSPSAKRKINDLRVEGPLTPHLPVGPLNKRARVNSEPDSLHEIDLVAAVKGMKGDDQDAHPADGDGSLSEILLPYAEKAQHILSNEQLIEADSTKRVPVPSVPDIVPIAPWTQSREATGQTPLKRNMDGERQSTIPLYAQDVDLHGLQQWHGNNRIERQLSWTPFPLDLGRADLDERIGDDTMSLDPFKKVEVAETLSAATLCWKRDGFRALDLADESDEEELAAVELDENDVQLEDIVQQHNIRSAELSPNIPGHADQVPPGLANVQKEQPLSQRRNTIGYGDIAKLDNGLLFGGGLIGADDIAELLRNKTPLGLHQGSRMQLPPDAIQLAATEHTSNVVEGERLGSLSFPTPDLPANFPNQTFIIRAGFLSSRRGLVARIEELHPKMELVERQWEIADQQLRQNHSMPDDGDLLVSPSTTMLVTSIAKVKQRPLPGKDTSHFGLKERIAIVSLRFEHVIVLVSDGSSPDQQIVRAMDTRDAQAIAEIMGFCAEIDAAVEVLFVPGGEPALARWIAAFLVRSAGETCAGAGPTKLLHEQTMWETFLRRLGVNAHAAQCILDALKAPLLPEVLHSSSDPISQNTQQSLSGLAAFLTMAPTERTTLLASVLGGTNVMKHVSGNLAEGWGRA